jgi:hypothetical protein
MFRRAFPKGCDTTCHTQQLQGQGHVPPSIKSMEPLDKFVSVTPEKSRAFWILTFAGMTCSEFPYNNVGMDSPSSPNDIARARREIASTK